MNAKLNTSDPEDEAPEATQETDEYPWETDTSSGDTEQDGNNDTEED